MRPTAFLLSLALLTSACGDASADAPAADAPTTATEAPADADAPEASGDDPTDADPAEDPATSTSTPAPEAGDTDDDDVRDAVARFLKESVSDGPQPPSLEAWDDVVNVQGTAAYYAAIPAMADDVTAFEDFCGGIASAIAPGEGGVVRAYLRRGTAGGWTVIDSEVCYDSGNWTSWAETYSLPEGLIIESAP